MLEWQKNLISIFALYALTGFFVSYYYTKYRKNAWGMSFVLELIGAFVWGDGVIFGLFWSLASLVILYINNWTLFLLTYSTFWLVRSVGETIYWFNEQFAPNHINHPHTLPFQKIFHDHSVWFILQIFWQCVTVVTIITTIYLTHIWLASLK